MIAVDTNVLIYAHRSEGPWHQQARGALKALAEGICHGEFPRRAWLSFWLSLLVFVAQ